MYCYTLLLFSFFSNFLKEHLGCSKTDSWWSIFYRNFINKIKCNFMQLSMLPCTLPRIRTQLLLDQVYTLALYTWLIRRQSSIVSRTFLPHTLGNKWLELSRVPTICWHTNTGIDFCTWNHWLEIHVDTFLFLCSQFQVLRIILNLIAILKFNQVLSRISYEVQGKKINFQFYFDGSQAYLRFKRCWSRAAYKLLTHQLDF